MLDFRLDATSFECLGDLWNNFLSYRGHKDDMSYAMIHDEALQALLDEMTPEAGHTAENVEKTHKYIKENALAYSFYSFVNFHGATEKISNIVSTAKLYPVPGAWSYTS